MEEVVSHADPVTLPTLARIGNLAVAQESTERLFYGRDGRLMEYSMVYAAAPLSVVLQEAHQSTRFMERVGNGTASEGAMTLEGGRPSNRPRRSLM